jgi:hypothetical protein
MQYEYRPGLATLELIMEVRRLLATERRTERLICRYLADLADRVREGLDNTLWGYADELHAARCIFGLGVRDTRERVRVGRALRELPRVEAAFVSGEVSYSRVRELTRVAEPSTETEWLELARTLDMRALERRVAAARAGAEGQRSEPTAEASPRTDKAARTEHSLRSTTIPRGSGGEHSRENCLLLCTTHHHLLHDGKLELSGDAEGELCFRDAEGHSFAGPDSLAALPTGTDETTPQVGSSFHGAAARLLHAIGRRGGWSLDALIEKLDLPARVVASALTELELAGSIRYGDFAYHPI